MTRGPTGSDSASRTLAGRYRLESELGRGAMGVVHRAHDLTLDRSVAVKLVACEALGTDGRVRLLHEARSAARLNHPGIVNVHDAGEESGSPYIVMELIEGRNLRECGSLPVPQVLAVVAQVAEALDHAHARGIVHRDVKPENILLVESDGRLAVKLTDFGVARSTGDARISKDGAIVGTALYMAPEQALGEVIDGRADLYALGVVLYELLAGRPPFAGNDALVVIAEHLYAPVVPPRTHRPDLPPAVEQLVLKLLAKRPEDRFTSARDLADAVKNILSGPEAAAEIASEPEPGATVLLLAQLARGRLIGRRSELSNLRELWNRALSGTGRLALISGEPGVGKTRLASEAIVHARLSGALVLRGGCYEFEAATPYLPFVEALRGWVAGRTPDQLRVELGTSAVELARLAPEIDAKIGPLPAGPSLSPNEERLRLFDNMARFLRARAAERGVLLFLDDLHWADPGTLALLHYLLRQLRTDRVLVLGAYREAELDRAHPLSAALVEWNREGLITRIALGRLSAAETGNLLATLFGQDEVSPEFAEAMYRETEGNPFFIEEVVKSLIEQGQIYREAGEWQRRDVSELAIPQSVKEAIGRRLNRLSDSCLSVLHTAAALGKVFAFEELLASAGAAEEEILDALDLASAAQLLRSERNDSFAFTHDKVREVLYSELNPVRRRRLHLKIGGSLETLHAAHKDAHVQDLAYHFTQGGQLDKGYEHSMRAGRLAMDVFDYDTALRYHENARECAESLADPVRLIAALESIGEVHRRSGRDSKAAEVYIAALDHITDPRERARIKALIGNAWCQIGDDRGREWLSQAIAELDPETQPAVRAQAIADMGRFHHYRMELAQAVEFLEEARRIAEPLGNLELLTWIYAYLAGAYQHLARWRDSIAWAERCIELGETRNYPPARAIGHEFKAEAHPQMGEWREALEHTYKNREIGIAIGAQDRVAWADFGAFLANLYGGNLAEARAAADASIALANEIGELRLATLCRAFRSTALTELGLVAEARADLDDLIFRSEKASRSFVLMQIHRAEGYHRLRLGQFEEADRAFTACEAIIGGTDHNLSKIFCYTRWVETLVGLGRIDQTAELLVTIDRIAAESTSKLHRADAQLLHGLVAEARNQPGEAIGLFDEAARLQEEIEAPLLLGQTLVHRARVLAGAGRHREAEADRERARSLFVKCGALLALSRLAGA